MQKLLHPGAKWIFRIRGFFGAIIFGWVLAWILFMPIALLLAKTVVERGPFAFFGLGIGVIIFYIIAVIVITEIYARMAYKRFLYEFTQDNLKVEKGIIWKRYSNVPYERVQNIDITRGILARILGFSSVMIQTAGFSYSGRGAGAFAEGYLPAVDMAEAEQIREFLMKKISKRGRSQGL